MKLDTSLLREKFIIWDINSGVEEQAIVAMSNRLNITLTSKSGEQTENFIIRAQNMHSCIRMASQIVMTFSRTGALMNRDQQIKWAELWKKVVGEHEKRFNSDLWCSVYFRGRSVFSYGKYHPFLDIIEKCDAASNNEYTKSIKLAEDAFSELGKPVTIEHDENVGLVVHIEDKEAKCGIILRNALKNTTFNFKAEVHPNASTEKSIKDTIAPEQILNTCASFLEGIQLAFKIGMSNEKYNLGLIKKDDKEYIEAQSASRRIGLLNAEVTTFENDYQVGYRPERPYLGSLVIDAEAYAKKLLSTKK